MDDEQELDRPEIDPDLYFSMLCRSGPLPPKYERVTDALCLFLFAALLLVVVVIVCVDGQFSSRIGALNELNFYHFFFGIYYQSLEYLLTGATVLASGLIIAMLTLVFPKAMGVTMIFLLLLAFVAIAAKEIASYFSNNSMDMRLILGVFFGLCSLAGVYFLCKRASKIVRFGQFSSMSSLVVKDSLLSSFGLMVGLSSLQLLAWWVMSRLSYLFGTLDSANSSFNCVFSFLAFALLWLWLHGALIAASDYLTQALTVKWFYNLSGSEEDEITLRDIFRGMAKHSGTILFGACLTYIPESLEILLKRCLGRWKVFPKILSLSKYCYLGTILEHSDFLESSFKIYELRKRMKNTIKEMYMVGHLFGDIIKLFLALASVAIFWQLISRNISEGVEGNDYSPFKFFFLTLAMAGGLSLEVSTNFANLVGMSGDVSYFLFNVDLEIERIHYHRNLPFSTPEALLEILRPLTIGREWDGKVQASGKVQDSGNRK